MIENQSSNPYDEFPYPPLSFPSTHVGRLGAIGRTFGLRTVPPHAARVLDLGCGCGVNILAMAQLFPAAEFLGIDNSARQIEIAESARVDSGLENVKFLCKEITDKPESLGHFDYILAHGVYSWVPDPVKDAILKISRENLKPEGVAYVSYNCLPGWHMRGALREMFLIHTAGIPDLHKKALQSKKLLEFLCEATTPQNSYGKFLKEFFDELKAVDASYIAHEFLEAQNDAFYFRDFVARATRHGLGYLGDADPPTMIVENLPSNAAQILKSKNLNLLESEQYMDFVRNRTFRGTLLCHENKALNRTPDPSCLDDLHVSPLKNLKQPHTQNQPAILSGPGDMEWSLQDPCAADLFTSVVSHRNGLSVEELVAGVAQRHSQRLSGRESGVLRNELKKMLLKGFFKKFVDFTLGPVSMAGPKTSSENPEVLPLARWQAASGYRVSQPRLDMFQPDHFVAALLPLCDGTRDIAALVEGMLEAHRSGRFQIHANKNLVTEPVGVRQIVEGLCTQVLGHARNLGIILEKRL